MQKEETKEKADVLNGSAVLAAEENDFSHAIDLWQQALRIYHDLGLQAQEGNVLSNIGVAYSLQDEFDEAQRWLEAALGKLRPVDDDQKRWLANAHSTLGDIAARREQYAEARTHIEKSLTLRREAGHERHIARSLSSLAHICLAEKNYDVAKALYQESLRIRSKVNAPAEIAPTLENLANVTAIQAGKVLHKELFKSIRLFAAAHKIRETFELAIPPCNQADYDASILALRHHTEDKDFSLAWSEGKAMSLDQAVEYALAD